MRWQIQLKSQSHSFSMKKYFLRGRSVQLIEHMKQGYTDFLNAHNVKLDVFFSTAALKILY